MPYVEQRAGNCYVWVISSFLFICIAAGGTFLFLYITQPETESTAWYPFAGVSLVGLPWFFWFITFFYRILSRACGFRMVCWGANYNYAPGGSVAGGSTSSGLERGVSVNAGAGGGGGTSQGATPAPSALVNAAEPPQSRDGGKHVHFGAAVVVEGTESSAGSWNSKESEMPLKLSMAS